MSLQKSEGVSVYDEIIKYQPIAMSKWLEIYHQTRLDFTPTKNV